ncbi:MAG: hypothetical protein AABY22_32180 [Nanoarchaeota archaeon]
MVNKKIRFRAEFFDIFGAIVFLYIVILSIWGLINNNMPKLAGITLLLIGIGGLIIDSSIVIRTYLIKKK